MRCNGGRICTGDYYANPSCNKHCNDLGYLAGTLVTWPTRCRCRKVEESCGSDAVDQWKRFENLLCYYDVCTLGEYFKKQLSFQAILVSSISVGKSNNILKLISACTSNQDCGSTAESCNEGICAAPKFGK